SYGTKEYSILLQKFLNEKQTLAYKYAKERNMNMIPIKLKDGTEIKLSAGEHSELIKKIVEDFASRYAPGGELAYVGDTGDKWGYFDAALLKKIGVELDNHGKLPDVIIYFTKKNWLLLIESVTSHGPVDSKRYEELSALFKNSTAGLVYISAFPTKKIFLKYLKSIAWETEVWIADAPTHMIHFNGSRFLGPY
ncbi:MAG: BsuBI/PstI family type II restriction endonuclease, partial [bacterium]